MEVVDHKVHPTSGKFVRKHTLKTLTEVFDGSLRLRFGCAILALLLDERFGMSRQCGLLTDELAQ